VKLFRFGAPGEERPGVLLPDGARVDASGFGADWNEAFFGQGDAGMARLAKWIASDAGKAPRVPAGTRLASAIARPSKLVCIGLNYRDHARESGASLPGEPIVFLKATSALAGPEDDLRLPIGGDKTDWEVELALVIGARAKYVAVEDAMKHVAGFVLHNDYSERGFQLERHGQWTKGKSADGFAPLGPFLATPEELPGFAAVRLWLKVNGEAIYGTRPWSSFGEGPTETANGTFAESKSKPYTARDFRFTTRGSTLYAIQLAEPENGRALITSIRPDRVVKRVHLLGTNAPVTFEQAEAGLSLTLPANRPSQPAYVYRIEI